jgi:hypothetical protein
VPLSEKLAERLREFRRDTYRGDKAPVFAALRGRELHPSNVSCRVLKPAAIAAGLLRPVESWPEPGLVEPGSARGLPRIEPGPLLADYFLRRRWGNAWGNTTAVSSREALSRPAALDRRTP